MPGPKIILSLKLTRTTSFRDQIPSERGRAHKQNYLERSFLKCYLCPMARPREFDTDSALDGAIAMFREHGFEGSSAQMLVDAMGIGRQSLYAAFGDKWQLYCSAVRRYVMGECAAHFEALRSGVRGIDGIDAMLRREGETADQPCLCAGSICD